MSYIVETIVAVSGLVGAIGVATASILKGRAAMDAAAKADAKTVRAPVSRDEYDAIVRRSEQQDVELRQARERIATLESEVEHLQEVTSVQEKRIDELDRDVLKATLSVNQTLTNFMNGQNMQADSKRGGKSR